jgi:hypothetical protein
MQVLEVGIRVEVAKRDLPVGKSCEVVVVTVFEWGEKRFWVPGLCPCHCVSSGIVCRRDCLVKVRRVNPRHVTQL